MLRILYLKDIMDALFPSSSYEKVVFMKGSQIGGTEAGNNWGGYMIDQAPGPMLVVQPIVEMGKRWSKGRLAPLNYILFPFLVPLLFISYFSILFTLLFTALYLMV